MPWSRARDVVSREVVAPRGYNTGGATSLLTVERSTLTSRVAMGTLGAGATPTLGAVSSVRTIGDTMVHRLRIAIHKAMASCDVAGMAASSAQRTSHAANIVTSSGEMVGIAQWLG